MTENKTNELESRTNEFGSNTNDELSDEQKKFSFGRNLWIARQEKGISLAEIAEITKIREETLLLIEEGNHEKLPNKIFVMGFIRAYADALKIDKDENINLYKLNCQQNQNNVRKEIKIERSRKRVKIGFVSTLFIVIIGIIIAGVFFLINYNSNSITNKESFQSETVSSDKEELNFKKTGLENTASATGTQEKTEVEIKTKTNIAESTVTLESSDNAKTRKTKLAKERSVKKIPKRVKSNTIKPNTAKPNAVKPGAVKPNTIKPNNTQSVNLNSENNIAKTVNSKKFKLKIDCIEETWIKIIIDRKKTVEYLLRPGNQKQLEANNNFNVLLGNATGVKLTLNGKKIKVPGKNGQIATIQIP
ncbi:MAG: hypothetical protein B6I31_04410 [Desulfobacteraceae bacterium 4572_19]|nr:MAG: hypothetical protein B6I31_04410 [Desulfobacteraceae bacterium 4572_19]